MGRLASTPTGWRTGMPSHSYDRTCGTRMSKRHLLKASCRASSDWPYFPIKENPEGNWVVVDETYNNRGDPLQAMLEFQREGVSILHSVSAARQTDTASPRIMPRDSRIRCKAKQGRTFSGPAGL